MKKIRKLFSIENGCSLPTLIKAFIVMILVLW